MKVIALLLSVIAVADAGHCYGSSVPAYCCIVACDSQYANNPAYYGPGTTPDCGPGVETLADIYATASSMGCSPLTEDSCSFGPNAFQKCEVEVALSAGAAAGVTVQATGDPHLSLPHGGRADFRGEDKTYYNFLSAKNLAVNVMTENADFELHNETHERHKHVHGSFLTQAHIVVKTSTSKMVRVSFWASKIGANNIGWANGTVDDITFTLSRYTALPAKVAEKVVDDVTLQMGYTSLTVLTPEFEIVVTPQHFFKERNVEGMNKRLDLKFNLRVPENSLAVAPHGIIGQGWDLDGKAIDGEQDAWPVKGEFTTYAMAQGAIEGHPNDYKLASKYATDFKFSRFDATTAAPRNVESLVAKGLLNTPKKVATAATDSVGSTEHEEPEE